MDKLKPCPFCGNSPRVKSDINSEDTPFYQVAHDCMNLLKQIKTFCYKTEPEAIAAWNRRAQPENEPHTNDALTRDELYYLDGEPLYVMDGEGHECYCVVNTKNEDCIDNEAGAWCFEFYDMTGDGKHGLHKMGWRAYRRKPERSGG